MIIGDNVLEGLHTLIEEHCPASAYAVITDSSVQPLYGERVARTLAPYRPTVLVPFPAGEWNKTRETWADVTDRMLAAQLDRQAAVVALGGGVVGDVAGFVAATYHRGVAYVQVPTTLLAMIDSSVGGKTGLDTPHGKNVVGAFHQPRLVAADLTTLRTLPPPHIAAGMAEAIKHAVIADAAYFDRLVTLEQQIHAADLEALLDVVSRSVEIKAAVVTADERETGYRAVLNFGHTVAHALEAVSGFALLHGEAVALGMLVETALGIAHGVTEPATLATLRNALERFRLPHELPDTVTPAALIKAMQHDKKLRAGTVRFALVERIGCVARGPGDEWTHAVDAALVQRVLGEFV